MEMQLGEIVFYFEDQNADDVSDTALLGDWAWCHNGKDNSAGWHTFGADGKVKNPAYGWTGTWSRLDNGQIEVGRLSPGDRHIFRVVDKNMLEITDPERNPSTRMIKRGQAAPGY